MKILLIHRYFWPDTPAYAVILKKIAARLAADGHDVEVLSTQPSYKPDVKIDRQPSSEQIDGYRIRRMSLLSSKLKLPGIGAVNMLLFAMKVAWHGYKRRRDVDVVMISTSPPVLAGWAARTISKWSGAKFIYHCMDIHPEIGRLTGEFKNPTVFRWLERADKVSCAKATKVVVLSNDMKQAIHERFESSVESQNGTNKPCDIEVIQNFSLDDQLPIPPVPEQFKKPAGTFRLVFAGNIGRFQGLDTFLDTFLQLQLDTPAELVFVGEGKLKEKLREAVTEAGAENVRFIPHQTMEVASSIIQTADLGLVSLNADVYRYAYPTKIIAYLGAKCPLLSVIEPESALAAFVENRQIGINVVPGDAGDLQNKLTELFSNPGQLEKMKINANHTFTDFYNDVSVLDKWSKLIADMESGSPEPMPG